MTTPTLPLFPLQTVLYPGGMLNLKIFEARYLDMVAACLREQRPFGVVALRSGSEVQRPGEAAALEGTGTLAVLIDVDSAQANILQIRCRGLQRFSIEAPRQQADGLWLADATSPWEDDPSVAPDAAYAGSVSGLLQAIDTMEAQGARPFFEPYRSEEAGWVANRWCEILPIPLGAKQRLLELRDPQLRLRLVDEFLRSKGVVRDE